MPLESSARGDLRLHLGSPGHEEPALTKLSVLMPVYNERWTLEQIVECVLGVELPLEVELVAVDDCSSDGSWDVLCRLQEKDPRLVTVRHQRNQGKGAAIRTAIANMTGDVAVFQDADLEYDPSEYPRLLGPLLSGDADAVFGSRYAGSTRKVQSFWHTMVNRGLTLCSNMLNDLNLTDMETCYKMVRADLLRELRLQARSFTLEPEITCRLSQAGARIYEVPVSYTGRSFEEGKKIRPVDGIKALWEMIRCRFLDQQYTKHERLLTLTTNRHRKSQRRWVQDQLRPYCGDRVAELNAGVGNLSLGMLNRPALVLAEADPLVRRHLHQRFGQRAGVAITELNFKSSRWRENLEQQNLDTIVCSDPLDCGLTVSELCRQCEQLLAPGGHLALLTDHGQIEHAGKLRDMLEAAGFEVVHQNQLRRGLVQASCWDLLVGRKPTAQAVRKAA